MKKCFLVIAMMLVLPSAYAADPQVIEKPVVAQSLDAFNVEVARIHEQMQLGGVYAFIKAGDRARVETQLGDIQKILQGHASANDLPKADKIALVNAQEEVNGILRHNDINRRICESRSPVGSHIPVTTCRTFGEEEQEREASLHQITDLNNQSRLNKHGN